VTFTVRSYSFFSFTHPPFHAVSMDCQAPMACDSAWGHYVAAFAYLMLTFLLRLLSHALPGVRTPLVLHLHTSAHALPWHY
jgi:hypothetical protein